MALTWKEDAESRQDLGFSGIIQMNTASFSLSDYTASGYAVNPVAFGLAAIRGLIPIGYTGTAVQYAWVYNATFKTLEVLQGNGTGPLAQVSVGTDLSGGTVRLLAYGF